MFIHYGCYRYVAYPVKHVRRSVSYSDYESKIYYPKTQHDRDKGLEFHLACGVKDYMGRIETVSAKPSHEFLCVECENVSLTDILADIEAYNRTARVFGWYYNTNEYGADPFTNMGPYG